MTIAICVNSFFPSIGGCEIVCNYIINALYKNHEIFVFTQHDPKRKISNFPYKIIEFRGQSDSLLFMNKIKEINPDVIFVYSDLFYFFKHLISLETKARIIFALCGANWLYDNQSYIGLFKKNIKKFHKIICHSKCDRDYKLCENSGILDHVIIIPNGVDLNEFDSNNVMRKNLLPDCSDKIWILNVSNFFPGKGQEYLIDILSGMNNLEELVYVQVSSNIGYKIGDILEDSWRKKIETSRIRKKGLTVKFVKDAERNKVIGFFKNSNVFAFTSEKEVAPLVLLESMASNLPWVSADVGNAEELAGGQCIKTIKNSKYHSIFDERVMNLFREHLQNYFLVSNLEAGRQQIEEKMTWNKIVPRYLSIIED